MKRIAKIAAQNATTIALSAEKHAAHAVAVEAKAKAAAASLETQPAEITDKAMNPSNKATQL